MPFCHFCSSLFISRLFNPNSAVAPTPLLSACSHRKWSSCDPLDLLKVESAPVYKTVADDKKDLENLLKVEGRKAR